MSMMAAGSTPALRLVRAATISRLGSTAAQDRGPYASDPPVSGGSGGGELDFSTAEGTGLGLAIGVL